MIISLSREFLKQIENADEDPVEIADYFVKNVSIIEQINLICISDFPRLDHNLSSSCMYLFVLRPAQTLLLFISTFVQLF